MFQKGDAVLAGVSGGPDSVALLYVLLHLAPRWELRIGVAHLNHCLRGSEADKDADFVTELAARLHLPCYQERINVQEYRASRQVCLEDAARQVRYGFLDRIRRQHGYHKTALGHHSGDNAELMLMFLFRGSGLSGLSGIPPVRSGHIVRPLLYVSREDIMAFLRYNGLSFCTDTSNSSSAFLRNRIRHEIIPHIQKICNPKIIETLNRLSEIIRSENEWIQDVIHPLYEKALVRTAAHKAILSVSVLQSYPEAVRRRIIRMAVENIRGNLKRISFSHIESALHMITGSSCSGVSVLPDGTRIQREAAYLSVFQTEPLQGRRYYEICATPPRPFYYEIPRPSEKTSLIVSEIGMTLTFTEISLASRKPGAHLSGKFVRMDIDKLEFPLVLRNIRPGDRFTPSGMTGSQKIKKYFIDHKITRTARRLSPVLLSHDRIIWLVGHRIGNDVPVTPATRMVLQIDIEQPATDSRPDGD